MTQPPLAASESTATATDGSARPRRLNQVEAAWASSLVLSSSSPSCQVFLGARFNRPQTMRFRWTGPARVSVPMAVRASGARSTVVDIGSDNPSAP